MSISQYVYNKAILEAVNAPFLENYSKTAGIISSSRDNLAITEGLNLITSVRKKNLSTRISYNSINKWRQTNCPSLAGLHVGFSCLFTNYAFINKSTKKTFLEKQQVKKKEIVVESLLSCPPLYLLPSLAGNGEVFSFSPLEKDSSVITKVERQVPPFQ